MCSEVQDGSKQPAGQQTAAQAVAPAAPPAAGAPAAKAAGADKKRTAGRQLRNEQVMAIHRYAVSMGLVFKEVSLEEVVDAPGGVEKYSKMTAAGAQKEYGDNTYATPARHPRVFPILMHRHERGL